MPKPNKSITSNSFSWKQLLKPAVLFWGMMNGHTSTAAPVLNNPLGTVTFPAGQPFTFTAPLTDFFMDPDGDTILNAGVTMANGQPVPDWMRSGPEKVFGRDYVNDIYDLDVYQSNLYFANGDHGVLVLDQFKNYLGAFDTLNEAHGIKVFNGTAFVADWSGLELVNIENPPYFFSEGRYSTSGFSAQVDVDTRGIVALATTASSLKLFDATDKSNVLSAHTRTPNGNVIAVRFDGTVLYFIEGGDVVSMDVLNPYAPTQLDTVVTNGSSKALAISGDFIAVADFGQGVALIDKSNPSAMVVRDTYDTPGDVQDIAFIGTRIFALDDSAGLFVFDASNPDNLVLEGVYPLPGTVLAVDEAIAYMGFRNTGVTGVDISVPGTFSEVMPADILSYPSKIKLDNNNNRAQVLDRFEGLYNFDISNLGAITPTHHHKTPADLADFDSNNDLVFAADLMGVRFLNKSTLASVYNYTYGSGAKAVAITGDLLQVLTDQSFELLSIAQITQPIVLNSSSVGGSTLGRSLLFTQNNITYVSTNRFQVYDVGNPQNLELKSTYQPGDFVAHVSSRDTDLYLSLRSTGLSTVEAANSSALVEADLYQTTDSINAYTYVDNLGLAAHGSKGLHFINKTGTAPMQGLGDFPIPGVMQDIAINANYTVFAVGEGCGLQLFDLKQLGILGIPPASLTGRFDLILTIMSGGEWLEMPFTVEITPSVTNPSPTISYRLTSTPSAATRAATVGVSSAQYTPIDSSTDRGEITSDAATTTLSGLTESVDTNSSMYSAQSLTTSADSSTLGPTSSDSYSTSVTNNGLLSQALVDAVVINVVNENPVFFTPYESISLVDLESELLENLPAGSTVTFFAVGDDPNYEISLFEFANGTGTYQAILIDTERCDELVRIGVRVENSGQDYSTIFEGSVDSCSIANSSQKSSEYKITWLAAVAAINYLLLDLYNDKSAENKSEPVKRTSPSQAGLFKARQQAPHSIPETGTCHNRASIPMAKM